MNVKALALLHRVFRPLYQSRETGNDGQTGDFVGKDYYRDQEFSLSKMGCYWRKSYTTSSANALRQPKPTEGARGRSP
jgi:hypothetical protein